MKNLNRVLGAFIIFFCAAKVRAQESDYSKLPCLVHTDGYSYVAGSIPVSPDADMHDYPNMKIGWGAGSSDKPMSSAMVNRGVGSMARRFIESKIPKNECGYLRLDDDFSKSLNDPTKTVEISVYGHLWGDAPGRESLKSYYSRVGDSNPGSQYADKMINMDIFSGSGHHCRIEYGVYSKYSRNMTLSVDGKELGTKTFRRFGTLHGIALNNDPEYEIDMYMGAALRKFNDSRKCGSLEMHNNGSILQDDSTM